LKKDGFARNVGKQYHQNHPIIAVQIGLWRQMETLKAQLIMSLAKCLEVSTMLVNPIDALGIAVLAGILTIIIALGYIGFLVIVLRSKRRRM
jgi:hypothetical protein